MTGYAILIPAAGLSRRMRGADKLLEDVDGVPVLRRMATAALGATPVVLVTVPDLAHARVAALAGLPLRIVAVPDHAEGMAASLRAGVTALPPGCLGVVVCPADMPDISVSDFDIFISALGKNPDLIHQALTASGARGHPVAFPAWSFPEILDLTGDAGAKAVLQAHPDKVNAVATTGQTAVTDLDTPEAWAAWRAARSLP